MLIDLRYEIPFTQFMRPDGRPRSIKWTTQSEEEAIKGRALIEAGAIFETEVLQTGQVSFTCDMVGNDGEPHTIAHEIAERNDECLLKVVEKLILSAHEVFINKGVEMMS